MTVLGSFAMTDTGRLVCYDRYGKGLYLGAGEFLGKKLARVTLVYDASVSVEVNQHGLDRAVE